MAEYPILFNTEMVRAILDGRKTMTRRVIRCSHMWAYGAFSHDDNRGYAELSAVQTFDPMYSISKPCPYGQPGDRLWVRETWATSPFLNDIKPSELSRNFTSLFYRANQGVNSSDYGWHYSWRPSIHMPRWASRITLEVTSVRVERVQDITLGDIKAEGIGPLRAFHTYGGQAEPYTNLFASLWDTINAKRGYSWDNNPWVWGVEFKVI